MNHQQKLFIKNRIESCKDEAIQYKAFKIIQKCHPDKTYKETDTHFMYLFHNLSATCYLKLFKLVKDIKNPNEIEWNKLDENHDHTMYCEFLKSKDQKYLDNLNRHERRVLFNKFIEDKRKTELR